MFVYTHVAAAQPSSGGGNSGSQASAGPPTVTLNLVTRTFDKPLPFDQPFYIQVSGTGGGGKSGNASAGGGDDSFDLGLGAPIMRMVSADTAATPAMLAMEVGRRARHGSR
jgi:hypothetical protein